MAEYGKNIGDSGAVDRAIQYYQVVCKKYAEAEQFVTREVLQARLELGRLLFDRDSYAAARRHVQRFVEGGMVDDESRSMLAESSLN